MRPRFLDGRLIYLRGISEDDLKSGMAYWSDDREVTRYLFRGAFPADLGQMLRQRQATLENPNEVELAIVAKEGDKVVGTTGLHCINWISRNAEFRILIGEKEFWNLGLGTEAAQLMAAYGFEMLNLHKIWLGSAASNRGATKSYEKAGFVREGVLRDDTYRNGVYYDTMRMSLLKSEYEDQRPTWKIAEELARMFPEPR